MIKHAIRIFAAIFIMLLLTYMQCEGIESGRKFIQFTNNSENGIILDLSINYPDTTPSFTYIEERGVRGNRFVAAHSTNDSALYHMPVSLIDAIFEIVNFDRFYEFTDTLSFYIIDEEVYKKEGPFRVQLYNLVKQRYDLSKADMEYLEYKLSYPPSPKMRGMKMFPPYEEAIK